MFLLRYFAPLRAYRDLRFFLSQRRPHELLFLTLSITITLLLIAGFVHDSHIPTPYKENIIYVEQWPADRTEAQILAQQKIDSAAKHKQDAMLEKQRRANQAQFQALDNHLTAMGL